MLFSAVRDDFAKTLAAAGGVVSPGAALPILGHPLLSMHRRNWTGKDACSSWDCAWSCWDRHQSSRIFMKRLSQKGLATGPPKAKAA
jgi:hypothetical protein